MLEAVRDQYGVLFDEAPVGYVTLDDNGFVLPANRRAAALLGVAQATDLPGRNLAAHLDEQSADEFHRHLANVLAGAPNESAPQHRGC